MLGEFDEVAIGIVDERRSACRRGGARPGLMRRRTRAWSSEVITRSKLATSKAMCLCIYELLT